jgi:folate-binding protein YgfZ
LVDLSGERAAVSVRGPDALAVVSAQLGIDVPETAHAFVATGGCLVVRADWPGNPGVDILGPRADVDAIVTRLGLPVVDVADAERLRIESGVPRQGVDIDDTTIPQEAFLERDAVSFTKGCFLGQELVCRIDSRGHVNRFLRVLTLPAPVEPGAVVTAAGGEVGRVTSVAPTSAGAVALATLRREVDPGATVRVADVDATVVAVPEP